MLEILKELDFTQGEIKVYEALLELGETTIGPISKKSGITPSKTYPILEKLLKKGLIAKVRKDKTLFFAPNNPERILTYLDEKRHEIENKKIQIKKELPRLKMLHKEIAPDARVLQGIGGLKTFYEEQNRLLLKGKKVFKVFSFEDEWKREEVKRFIQKQDIIRKELGIEVRVIANEKIKKYIKKEEYKLVNIRFTKQNIPVGTVVSEKQIALMTWKQMPLVIIIDSKEIGEAYERFFDDIWKQSKK
ncbi:helix-turn-helix domain-containing protein [Candidatus Woesearchaeota archaeon]|nr:helix-turn-helix domain-containing protein [Candidatus Woesearchaeota archaeon]